MLFVESEDIWKFNVLTIIRNELKAGLEYFCLATTVKGQACRPVSNKSPATELHYLALQVLGSREKMRSPITLVKMIKSLDYVLHELEKLLSESTSTGCHRAPILYWMQQGYLYRAEQCLYRPSIVQNADYVLVRRRTVDVRLHSWCFKYWTISYS